MPVIYKRKCDNCGKYYKGQGYKYCSKKCYGLVPISDKTRQKLKEKRKGRKPTLGRKHTKSWKENHSSKMKVIMKGKNNPSYGRTGIRAFHWKGGITLLGKRIRQHFKYRQWRSDVFTRDNFICQSCNKKSDYLEAHHIKSFAKILREYKIKILEEALNCEELWNINNGITLCKKCHRTKNEFK